jgi:O-antigen/teichoic acid export membrane protein
MTAPRGLLATVSSLIATTGITASLGVVFWWVAAHHASLASVGDGSAAVSAMTLVGTFGMAGLNTALISHLARRPRSADADGLLSAGLCTAAVVSALIATFLWLAATLAGGAFAPYLHSRLAAVVFITGSALTGAGMVLDEALLGLLGGGPQLWRNSAFAVTKLVALAILAALWHDRFGAPLLTAWVTGAGLSLAVAAVLLRRRGVRLLARPDWRALRRLSRASATNTWLNNALTVPELLTPVLVTGLIGAANGGAFYVASTVMAVVTMMALHFTNALYAASVADPDGLAARLRFSLRTCLLGGLAGVPIVVLAAHPLLHVFGAQYAARAALPLEVMIGGYFGTVLKYHYVAVCRMRHRVTGAAVFSTVTCVLRVAAIVAGALAHGLLGLCVGMVIMECAEGLYGTPTVLAALRGDRAAAAATAAPAPRAPRTQPAPAR